MELTNTTWVGNSDNHPQLIESVIKSLNIGNGKDKQPISIVYPTVNMAGILLVYLKGIVLDTPENDKFIVKLSLIEYVEKPKPTKTKPPTTGLQGTPSGDAASPAGAAQNPPRPGQSGASGDF